MFKKSLLLSLVGLSFAPALGSSLEVGLELSPIVDKVESSGWGSISKTGIKLVIAFERRCLVVPEIQADAKHAYNIRGALAAVDISIRRVLLEKQSLRGLTSETFPEFATLKKRYFDALPEVLREQYGYYAEPYIAEISRARGEFEAAHDGNLLTWRK